MRALASGGALALAGLLGLGVAPAQAATVGASPDEPDIERQLELVRKRRDAIAALESELVAKRRRIRARQRELEREPEVNT